MFENVYVLVKAQTFEFDSVWETEEDAREYAKEKCGKWLVWPEKIRFL